MIEGNHASGAAGDSLWQACIEQRAQELPEQQFNTWIRPLIATIALWIAATGLILGLGR